MAVLGLPGSALLDAGARLALVAAEAFADRLL